LISQARQKAPDCFQDQVNYTFGLVEWLNLLIENGSTPGEAHRVLVHANLDAARHIVALTRKMTLTAAICLDQSEEVKML
jgi:hypothetical protein